MWQRHLSFSKINKHQLIAKACADHVLFLHTPVALFEVDSVAIESSTHPMHNFALQVAQAQVSAGVKAQVCMSVCQIAPGKSPQSCWLATGTAPDWPSEEDEQSAEHSCGVTAFVHRDFRGAIIWGLSASKNCCALKKGTGSLLRLASVWQKAKLPKLEQPLLTERNRTLRGLTMPTINSARYLVIVCCHLSRNLANGSVLAASAANAKPCASCLKGRQLLCSASGLQYEFLNTCPLTSFCPGLLVVHPHNGASALCQAGEAACVRGSLQLARITTEVRDCTKARARAPGRLLDCQSSPFEWLPFAGGHIAGAAATTS